VLRGAEYVAPMIAYLLTDQAWNINGKIFHVSGGTVGIGHEEAPIKSIETASQWTVDALAQRIPGLLAGTPNPAPPPADLDLPGRPVAAED